jgi:hypothetical protein
MTGRPPLVNETELEAAHRELAALYKRLTAEAGSGSAIRAF